MFNNRVSKQELLPEIWNTNFISEEFVTKAELDEFAENIERVLNEILQSQKINASRHHRME